MSPVETQDVSSETPERAWRSGAKPAPPKDFWESLSVGLFGFTWGGIQSIFRKEMIQLLRDPMLVAFIITLPVVQLLVTGLAVQRDLKHIPTLVANYDNRQPSFELLRDFQHSELFAIDTRGGSEQQVVKAVRSGAYRVGIIIPPDYSENALSGQSPAQVNVIIDGTQGNIAKTIVSGAQLIVANHQKKLAAEAGVDLSQLPDAGIDMNAKILYNPNMSTSFFLVPAILAIVMHMLTILFTSFAIVRERENGTLEQLMVTPVRVGDLMLGKVLPYALIGFMDMLLTLVVMVWFFSIRITGSFWYLCVASIIFILTSLGMGLLISTLSRTQVQAIQLTVAIFLPSLLLTGFVFPLEPMPWFIKIISYSLPLTYYLEIIRGVVIKGIGAGELWLQTSVLTGMALLLLGASILRFKKQIT